MQSRLTAVLASTVVWLVVLAAPAHAAFPGQNGKIAFVSTRDGNPEIYTMNTDGSGVTRLTNDPQGDCWPKWSADGKRIVFGISGSSFCGFPTDIFPAFDLYVMNKDGSNVVRLTTDGGTQTSAAKTSATWSPDGSKIAFSEPLYPDPHVTMYSVRPDGTNLAPMFTTDSFSIYDPAWSPDGSRFAISSARGRPEAALAIATVKVDGSDYSRLPAGVAFAPNWSPDGSQIVFDLNNSVSVINADGTGPQDLMPGQEGDWPAWSPDGSKIVFNRGSAPNAINTDLYTINPDGTGLTRLTNNNMSDDQPDWQPLPGPQLGDYKNAAQFCKAERDFLGDAAFAQKYGTNRNGANASGKCVSHN
jgi:Tol biopolymer transport system component